MSRPTNRARASSVASAVVDQALSSATNFGVGVVIARFHGARGLGAFTIGFTAYLLALNVNRGLVTEPLAVRYSATDEVRWRQGVADAAGAALCFGLVAAVALIAAGYVMDNAAAGPLKVIGTVLPGLLLQDVWRYAFFAQGRGWRAVINDSVWVIALIPLTLVALTQGKLAISVIAWGVAGVLAGIAGIWQSRVIPALGSMRRWWRAQRDISHNLVVEYMTLAGFKQLTVYGVGMVAGLTAVGSIRTAELLFGPISVATLAVPLFAVPRAVGILREQPETLGRALLLLTGAIASAAAFWTLTVLIVPDSWGRWLLAGSWEAAKPLLIPVAITVAVPAIVAGPLVGLRALAASRSSRNARLVMATSTTALGLIGAGLGGATYAAWGLAMGSAIGMFVWMHQFARAYKPSEEMPWWRWSSR